MTKSTLLAAIQHAIKMLEDGNRTALDVRRPVLIALKKALGEAGNGTKRT